MPAACISSHSITHQRGGQLAALSCQVIFRQVVLENPTFEFRLYPTVLSYEGSSSSAQDEYLDNVHRFPLRIFGYSSKMSRTKERLGENKIFHPAKLVELTKDFHRLYWGGARSRAGTLHQLTSNISGKENLAGPKPGPSDLALFSAIVNLKLQGDLSSEVFIFGSIKL